jgi:hypothetical protein
LGIHHTTKLRLFLLSLYRDLLSDLLFDLLQSFQEKLLYLRPLIEHNLCQGPDIFELFRFDPKILPQSCDVFPLLLDDLLMLELEEFLLLLKIIYDLLK